MINTQLWVERYRPKTFDEYVWTDETQRRKAENWVSRGYTPNLLLCGRPGTGKTSLAKMILRQIGVEDGDILYIEANKKRKIDELEERITQFTETFAFSDNGIKYVILDEADSLSQHAQKFLRSELELDTVRFIFTCNYENKIIEPLHSRLEVLHFSNLNTEDFLVRCGEILTREGVEFDIENLQQYANARYPDLRKCIGSLENATLGGVLQPFVQFQDNSSDQDYLLEAYALFKTGRFLDGRKLILENSTPEDYNDIFRWFYTNLDIFDDQDAQNKAILCIRTALVNHTLVADPEINLAALMVELSAL